MHKIWDAGKQLSILNNSITAATLSRGNDISVRIGKSNIIKFGVDYGMGTRVGSNLIGFSLGVI
jgi:hypothetical protein